MVWYLYYDIMYAFTYLYNLLNDAVNGSDYISSNKNKLILN
jgi:hypothetical protein